MGRRRLFDIEEVDQCIRGFEAANGHVPSCRELAQALGGVSTRTAHRYMRELEQAGRVERVSPRNYKIKDRGHAREVALRDAIIERQRQIIERLREKARATG